MKSAHFGFVVMLLVFMVSSFSLASREIGNIGIKASHRINYDSQAYVTAFLARILVNILTQGLTNHFCLLI